jgi:hypothetical protein
LQINKGAHWGDLESEEEAESEEEEEEEEEEPDEAVSFHLQWRLGSCIVSLGVKHRSVAPKAEEAE